MAKTALDLTPEERRKYRLVPAPERQEIDRDRGVELRWEEAWDLVKTAAGLLRKKFGATRVAVFGSLVHEEGFGRWSDIDLAAWGIPPEQFYSAVARVTSLSSSFKVDLVDIEECRPTLRKLIEQEGIEI